jgi:hypothetical protein
MEGKLAKRLKTVDRNTPKTDADNQGATIADVTPLAGRTPLIINRPLCNVHEFLRDSYEQYAARASAVLSAAAR